MPGVRNVVIVGGGLAGLCCARAVQRAGHEARVFEASDGLGGRVRTDNVEGFLLDRGFQVMFTAYPAIRQELDLKALRLHPFDPGAHVWWNGRLHTVADPLRKPSLAFVSASSPLFPLRDKMLVAKLSVYVMRLSVREIFALPDRTMEEFLRGFGFSEAFLERFMRPFFAGIFIEKEMETSARMFLFVFKMMAEGQTALPERGNGALAEQIAAGLLPGTVRLNSPVRELIREGGRVTGVVLESGERVGADVVVVTAPGDKAAELTGIALPLNWRKSVTLYFALPEPLPIGKMLMLFPGEGLVNDAAILSNVVPSYAPAGQALLTTTVLGDPDVTDDELAAGVRAEMAGRFPKAGAYEWPLLRAYRNRWAQYAQTPGFSEHRPSQDTGVSGLVLAGEIAVSSSTHGALVSGQRAAALALSARQGRELVAA